LQIFSFWNAFSKGVGNLVDKGRMEMRAFYSIKQGIGEGKASMLGI
jgi:hypothetical protein